MSEGIIIAIISAGSAIVAAIISAVAASKSKGHKTECEKIKENINNINNVIVNVNNDEIIKVLEELKKITEKIEKLQHLMRQKSITKKNQSDDKVQYLKRKSLNISPEQIELDKLLHKRIELEVQLRMLMALGG